MRKNILVIRLVACVSLLSAAALDTRAQQPVDLFSDEPTLGAGFLRLAAWNLRHINLESGADVFLPGTTADEDFAILTATFAKAIRDLALDLVAVVEVQPRAGEPNRLQQIRNRLNGGVTGPWRSDQTSIPYDEPVDEHGGLQFGLLWDSAKVAINPSSDELLSDLRQPRNDAGNLINQDMRIPWLIPVKAGNLQFDLMVLHLKSGGGFPQADEVNALQQFITLRQSVPSPRHLIVCGDWNIRPDTGSGRSRLRKMSAPTTSGNLMNLLTTEALKPTLDEWETAGGSLANAPFSHYNPAPTIDTLLDHIAISRTFDEIFDHPIEVRLADGSTDLKPGIQIAQPLITEQNFIRLTDHLPVVLTLRTSSAEDIPTPSGSTLRIVAAIPNPVGLDAQDEEVRLKNSGASPVPLTGWKIGDSGTTFWLLNDADGVVQPGQTRSVKRLGRNMSLNNTGGDTIVLVHPTDGPVDQKSYGTVTSGQVLTFP